MQDKLKFWADRQQRLTEEACRQRIAPRERFFARTRDLSGVHVRLGTITGKRRRQKGRCKRRWRAATTTPMTHWPPIVVRQSTDLLMELSAKRVPSKRLLKSLAPSDSPFRGSSPGRVPLLNWR